MDNKKFLAHVKTRLDELIAVRTAEMKKEEAAGVAKPIGTSSLSNAKRSFDRMVEMKIATDHSLLEIFTNKQIFHSHGKVFLEALKDQERKKAIRDKRKPKFNSASTTKCALKVIFDTVGKELRAKAAGEARLAEITPDNMDFTNFNEAINYLARRSFPDATNHNQLAVELDKVPELDLDIGCVRWLRDGVTPQNHARKKIEHLELFFGVTSGTLTRFLPSGIALVDESAMVSYVEQPLKTKNTAPLSDNAQSQFKSLTAHFKGEGVSRHEKPTFSQQKNSELQAPLVLWTDHAEHGCVTSRIKMGLIISYQQWLLNNGKISSNEDFDLSYLLVTDLLDDYIKSRTRDGVYSSTKYLLDFIRLATKGDNGDYGYLALYHVPVDQLNLTRESDDSLGEVAFNEWGDSYKYLIKFLTQRIKHLDLNKESLDGKRNIRYLIDAKYRRELGLVGGIAEGAKEYKQVIEQLENDAKLLGNNMGARASVGYTATLVATLMRMVFQQPMRMGNWKSLRLVSYTDFLKTRVPAITKNKGHYMLRVPRNYVKNHRLLETTFCKKLTPVIDLFIEKRAAILEERGESCDIFLMGANVGVLSNKTLSSYTYKALKVLWPERDYITWGFNPHALRHFVATVYMAENPNNIYYCAELLQDLPQTVIDNYIEPDAHGIALNHSEWASQHV